MAGSILAVSSAAKCFGHREDRYDPPCLLHLFPTSPVVCARPTLLSFPSGIQSVPIDHKNKCFLSLLHLLLQALVLQCF
jgi:hypothetical protein